MSDHPNIERWTTSLRELTLFFDKYAGPRMRRLERRGILWVSGSMVAFATSVVLIGGEWGALATRSREVDQHLRMVVASEHAARRDQTRLGPVALLLANVNQHPQDSVSLDDVPHEFSSLFRQFHRRFDDQGIERATLDPCADAAAEYASIERFKDLDDYLSRTREYHLGLGATSTDARDRVAALDGFSFGPAGCVGEVRASNDQRVELKGQVATFIPTVMLPSPTSSPDPTPTGSSGFESWEVTCDSTPTSVQERLACVLATGAGALLELRSTLVANTEIAQAYFTSAGGGIAVWSRRAEVRQELWRDPMTYYGTAGYFTHFARRPHFTNVGNAVVTPAYFDLLGVGLVRTVCTPVYAGDRKLWLDLALELGQAKALVGVFCLDLSLPAIGSNEVAVGDEGATALTRPVNLDTPFFETGIYCLSDHEAYEYAPAAGTCASTRRPAGLSPEELQLVEQASTGPFVRFSDRPVRDQALGAGAVVLRLVDTSDDKVVALLRPRPLVPNAGRLVAGGLSFLMSMAFAGVASYRNQRERARLTTLELLRSLPVGVTMVDPDHTILFGNDRAEELLDMELPASPHDPPEGPTQRLDQCFEKAQPVFFSSFKPNGTEEARSRGRAHDLFRSDLEYLRKWGRPYRYRTHLNGGSKSDPGRPVVVTGSPILGEPGPSVGRATWGALEVFDLETSASQQGSPSNLPEES